MITFKTNGLDQLLIEASILKFSVITEYDRNKSGILVVRQSAQIAEMITQGIKICLVNTKS